MEGGILQPFNRGVSFAGRRFNKYRICFYPDSNRGFS